MLVVVSVGGLDQADMLVAEPLDGVCAGGDVEAATLTNGHSADMDTSLLPGRHDCSNEISALARLR